MVLLSWEGFFMAEETEGWSHCLTMKMPTRMITQSDIWGMVGLMRKWGCLGEFSWGTQRGCNINGGLYIESTVFHFNELGKSKSRFISHQITQPPFHF